MPLGSLADRYGSMRGFLLGLALFASASAACAASPTREVLSDVVERRVHDEHVQTRHETGRTQHRRHEGRSLPRPGGR